MTIVRSNNIDDNFVFCNVPAVFVFKGTMKNVGSKKGDGTLVAVVFNERQHQHLHHGKNENR